MEIVLTNLSYLIILFFVISVFGWCMEVFLKYLQYGRFINRGFLVGPYLPIYGTGVVLIVVLCDFISKYDSSVGTVFLASFVICGMWEYAVSFVFEKRFHARWWDYSTKPMNLNGRVWIGNLILFGIGGVIVNEIVNPLFVILIGRIPMMIQYVLSGVIICGMMSDYLFSHFVMKFIKTGIEGSEADNTEDISKEIMMLLKDKHVLYSRIIEAYPEISYRTDKIQRRLEEIKQETEKYKQELELRKEKAEEKISELQEAFQLKVFAVDSVANVEPGNLFDYIKWRGDISVKASPFNEIDNIILAMLPYVDFGDIIKGDSVENAITIEEAAKKFFDNNDVKEYTKRLSSTKNAIFVLREIAKVDRFKNMKLFSYVKDIDSSDTSQFTVLTVDIGNDTVYVAYAGTDDTIVGWHEDFNMAYLEHTMGQIKAKEYVENLKIPSTTRIILGGHSKGGNFAVSAAIYCSDNIKNRLIKIYNNDGPGFAKEIISSEQYQEIIPKMHSVMPSGSIVGTLFEHGDEFKYIGSTNIGLAEHDALSWQVLGTDFYEKESLSKPITKLNEQVTTWMDSMTLEEREKFVENLFSILDKANIKTVDDFASGKLADAFLIILRQRHISIEDKNRFTEVFKLLVKN